MGQNISTGDFSCIDCSTRLITIDDGDTSSRARFKDPNPEEESIDDEITVFESPIKTSKRQSFNESQDKFLVYDTSLTTNAITSPNAVFTSKKLYTRNRIIKRNTSQTLSMNHDDSYLSTLSHSAINLVSSSSNSNSYIQKDSFVNNSGFGSGRHKMYSSNALNVSINLVESIRKVNNMSSMRLDSTFDEMGTPRNS
ncbi:hypothetical protein SteCoe_12879 [Stentor coeruleus]|uniref:Uncharacterized protein n=1 Tax=Stentor coeruleus TaxID=5963 RepID=A0A1R2C9T5_9CILI|nr:hypothetical protein SteCoe_12879 [Stentor coeruleus]